MKLLLFIILYFFVSSFIFSSDQEIINNAIGIGDCETLYNFVQNPEGKDPRLVSTANQALRRYTTLDTAASRYRTNRMNERVRNLGRELTENVFLDPQRYLPDVVTRLVAGISDPFMKVKVINDWICDNIAYDVDHYFGRTYNRQDYVSVIRNKKGVCSGYAAVFNAMCRLASIESIGISGFSKGVGYRGYLGTSSDHEWNAVKISNKWYLIDVTWNAGYLIYRSFIKKYTTDYLFLDSRAFLYSHLPVESKYQFYAPVVTREQFTDEPYIAGIFFRYGLELKDELPRYNNLTDNGFTFELTMRNTSVTLSSQLRTKQRQNVTGASRPARSGNTTRFTFNVPDTGDFIGHVFARLGAERRIHEYIPVYTFEHSIIPTLDTLLENRRITAREKELFLTSYYKVEAEEHYYFLEDQFDTPRNNAVIKIHPLVNLRLDMMDAVLTFNLSRMPDNP